jgi:DNA-binding NtrC family response regulator
MNKPTILIVEDEAIVAEDLSGKIRNLGYEVVGITDNGEEAMALAAERRPDLVLMDIRLKGHMDGISTAARIVRDAKVPVIYLTAHSDRVTLQRAKLTGPFGYILKPFEDRELNTQIEIALYKHKLECELRESHDELARFNSVLVGRELRMIELKREINTLCGVIGEPPRYDLPLGMDDTATLHH